MIYEKVKNIIRRDKPEMKQAIITISAAVDVDLNSEKSVERQCFEAVMDADGNVGHLDGMEFEEVIEVRAHE